MAKKAVADVIDLDVDRPPPAPTDVDRARDGLASISFADDAPQAEPGQPTQPAPEQPLPLARPKRRTKAELEEDVRRLEADLAKAKATQPTTVDMMKPALQLTFAAAGRILTAWRGEHWSLKDDETKLLSEAWAPCVAPFLAQHPETVIWAAAIGVTYSVAYPRLQVDRAKVEALAAAEAEQKGEPDGTGTQA